MTAEEENRKYNILWCQASRDRESDRNRVTTNREKNQLIDKLS